MRSKNSDNNKYFFTSETIAKYVNDWMFYYRFMLSASPMYEDNSQVLLKAVIREDDSLRELTCSVLAPSSIMLNQAAIDEYKHSMIVAFEKALISLARGKGDLLKRLSEPMYELNVRDD